VVPLSPGKWIDTPLSQRLKEFGVIVLNDPAGVWCKRFGIRTSGHILVYDENQKLVFHGGITSSRGHEGPCNATLELERIVNKHEVSTCAWPVFGCSILVVARPKA
jgi:hypothetical protein